MPRILFFREGAEIPALDWLDQQPLKVRVRMVAVLELLEQQGHRLKRPYADYLEDGIYELRSKVAGINYRLLYFFDGQTAVVIAHGFTKQQAKVPVDVLHRAISRKLRYQSDPGSHSAEVGENE